MRWMVAALTVAMSSAAAAEPGASHTMSLDEAVEYLADTELLEVTPQSYRVRKRILDTDERGKQQKKAKEALDA